MSTIVLTSACIRDMLNGKALVFPPVVQVLARGFWKGGPKSGIRLRLSDSEFSSDRFALLPKCSINPQCFERWAVVRLTEYRNETFLAGAKVNKIWLQTN